VEFLSLTFLWAALFVSIPVAIALWNRKRFRREKFGGYFFLRKVAESTKRRLQLLQLLKLLNRILMCALIVLVFAEPLISQLRLKKASQGFALILDTGRVMQAHYKDGTTMVYRQMKSVQKLLDRMPSDVQGSILFVSNRCSSYRFSGGRLTASASDWQGKIQTSDIPYSNEPTTSTGLLQCLEMVKAIFSDKNILKVFVSSLPATLKEDSLDKEHLSVERLPGPDLPQTLDYKVSQQTSVRSVHIFFNWMNALNTFLINKDGTQEALGKIQNSIDLVPEAQSWLWIQSKAAQDPWANNQIVPIESLTTKKVTLWGAKETEGYLSLLTALRSHSSLQVIRQIGGKPVGQAVIIYGSYPYSLEGLNRAWFFVSPNAQSPFKVRDKKQWTAPLTSSDLRKAFQIKTPDGDIFIKNYVLFDLDSFIVLQSFEDGAPSLLQLRNSPGKIWVTPFDLEDLTTDLSLEPTFIPYLYRRLDRWLGQDSSLAETADLKPVWVMPGSVKASKEVLSRQAWPGIYGNENQYKVVQPEALPDHFLQLKQKNQKNELQEEKISLRPLLLKWLVGSVFVELLLCLMGIRFVLLGLCLCIGFSAIHPVQAVEASHRTPLGVFGKMDPDRMTALGQLVQDMSFLSNLDFSKPHRATTSGMWKYSMLVLSSAHSFPQLKNGQREAIRSYLDRGGLLFFDNPLGIVDSEFYQSVVKEMSKVLPGRSFKAIPKDDVIFRTFYLLDEVSGRKLSSPNLEGIELDGRWVAIFSFNDLLGAILKSSNGEYALSVSPYGIMQRRLSERLLLNVLMYSVAVDYKNDAIHLPYILRKRVR